MYILAQTVLQMLWVDLELCKIKVETTNKSQKKKLKLLSEKFVHKLYIYEY